MRWWIKLVRNLRILPRWVITFIDLFFISFSTFLGYLLRFNFSVSDLIYYHFEEGVLIYTVCGFVAIMLTGSYRGIIRYTGLQDSVRIFYMVVMNLVLVVAINLLFAYSKMNNAVPYSVILISLLSSFLFLFNYRLLVKYFFSFYRDSLLKRTRVMIFGAGQTGIITRHVVESSPRMRLMGFLEDNPDKIGKIMDGVRIFSARSEDIDFVINDYPFDEVIIASRNMAIDRRNELVDRCIENRIRVRMIPPIDKWAKGELSFNQIKDINIEDLLGRESIRLNKENVEREIKGKRICITGAAGSIGKELVKQVLGYYPECIIAIDQAESALYELERELLTIDTKVKVITFLADITNKDRISTIFKEQRPEMVFHAAAYKHVPMMESNPSEAVACNILGTKLLADLSVENGVKKFVMISTDKAVNPTNVMGCSKRIAEIYVQSLNNHLATQVSNKTAFVTTRFGNVLGSNGSVIPLFKRQIELGGPITVTHPEITRFFMTIPEAVQLVLEAGTMGRGGEIYVFDMGKSIKILDLAKKMIWLSGLEPDRDIEIHFTGLREGEKLYEELLSNHENTLPTHNQKILIAKVQEYSYIEINKFIELFIDLVNDRNELKMVALMKELVPEYKSNYSRYEVLDSKRNG
ncbi:MAG: nucleoside-diphosphate sugar epimerase/dehydratase [Cyclobacteriaceae bacterium]|nr:nucleoside-diphosphate sugar epimerase/dehydratase [Cyclobacteriaceae bacterium]